MQRREGRRRASLKRADAEAIQIKCSQREGNDEKKQERMQRLYKSRPRARNARRRARLNRADAEALQIKGP